MQATGRAQLRKMIRVAGAGAKDVTFVNVGNITYDPVTGTSSSTDTPQTLKCMVYRDTEAEKKKGVVSGCVKILFAEGDLGFAVNSEDEVSIDDVVYTVTGSVLDGMGVARVITAEKK